MSATLVQVEGSGGFPHLSSDLQPSIHPILLLQCKGAVPTANTADYDAESQS